MSGNPSTQATGFAFTIPIRVVSGENGSHGHWRKHAAKIAGYRDSTRMCWHVALREQGQAWDQAAVSANPKAFAVTLTRIAPRRLDDDDLRSALKAIRDEVAVCMGLPTKAPRQGQVRLIADDSDPGMWRYRQIKGAPKEYAVLVEIAPRGAIRGHCATCTCEDRNGQNQ